MGTRSSAATFDKSKPELADASCLRFFARASRSLIASLNFDSGSAAGEELGFTFLPCVLVGLSRAPDLRPEPASGAALLRAADLGAVVAPAGAMGGAAVLPCAERAVPLISVHNPCLLDVSAEALGLRALQARSYAEAAGMVLALREGIDPAALLRPLVRP